MSGIILRAGAQPAGEVDPMAGYWQGRAEAAEAERDAARTMRDTWHTRAEAHRVAAEAAEAELAIARATAYQVADVMTGEADVLRAEVARLRAALPEAGTLMRAASMLDSDYPGVANGLRIAAARIRALAAGADT